MDRTLEVDGDVVPVREFLDDSAVARGIVALEVVQRRVGENDAEAERVVGRVPLVNRDVGSRLPFLHQYREIQARRATTDNSNLHAPAPRSGRPGWKMI
jgi:hypothetical protein